MTLSILKIHFGQITKSILYSAALKGKGGNWTEGNLDKWLKSPADYAPGKISMSSYLWRFRSSHFTFTETISFIQVTPWLSLVSPTLRTELISSLTLRPRLPHELVVFLLNENLKSVFKTSLFISYNSPRNARSQNVRFSKRRELYFLTSLNILLFIYCAEILHSVH